MKTSPNFANTLKSKKDALLIFLGLTQLGYTFLIFIISIFFSHKLAGPIYKMKKILKNVRNNEGDQIVYLRKGDYFTDLASEINETLNTFTNHETTKYSNISEISSLLDEIGPSISDEYREKYDEISKKINELQGH
ncbi:MAG: hypothetical protein ISR65_07125 [Bacteriovoracaceae bacterium]|nr:hypothetical protein [Bacteriovoracaceae bacterium]